MISPTSFKRAQKIKKNLSFTCLVLSSSTIHTLVTPLSLLFRSDNLFQKNFPEFPIITSQISVAPDTTNNHIDAPLLVTFTNCGPVESVSPASASALPCDSTVCLSYTFTLRTVLDG
ncbi:unnamed protein product [Rhizophagus irregularis]|nr:unnamed protein product [Rhizophagus irregularis]